MEASITIAQLVELIAIIGGLWGGYKVICEIVGMINIKHDQRQKWDDYDKKIKNVEEEQCMLTYCMLATLDGLHQLGANGEVTKAKDKLEKHINEKAHGCIK